MLKLSSPKIILTVLVPTIMLLMAGSVFGNTDDIGAVVTSDSAVTLQLENDQIKLVTTLDNGLLVSDEIIPKESWLEEFGTTPTSIKSDGGFAFDIVWTDWRAPGKDNNGDVFMPLEKHDFVFEKHNTVSDADGSQELSLTFTGADHNFRLVITYRLGQDDFYVRRKLAIADTLQNIHFLQHVSAIHEQVSFEQSTDDPDPAFMVLKAGSFGQPAVVQWNDGGAFFGLEYPASENSLVLDGAHAVIQCRQMVGQKISSDWFETDWAVIGYVPEKRVKSWFMKYVDDIRVAPLRPYTLYNSWYDLRSVEYPRVPDSNWMNETNVFRMIRKVRDNMIEKHDIHLDAFVLDDGWDVYDSDWQLRTEQFPNGLKPLADSLKATGTDLGIWFGPTGGYSFRSRRLDWMKANGYEATGEEIYWHASCMCVGGEKYSKLLQRRTTGFVRNEGVGFFKWDGFQFSCSEPDHGHPVGIYSRRAILHSLFDMCDSVRSVSPNTFLNITSGTWLSPWWVQYANQIWMDGGDYGYADVPSISERDAAITYRDFVLYDDFKNKDLWFPIANLMTHGIIKGKLQMLGGKTEPIDKFTDNALLYFARGVSMWELYISPDILTPAEWDAMSQSIHWAEDRFDVLKHTEMIGGNPTMREPYGYIHCSGSRAILAVRNPFIEDNRIEVNLSPEYGLNYNADSLVIEKVYPERYVYPDLYSAGDTIEVPLGGYEMAVYEIYPLAEATGPLVSGVEFSSNRDTENVLEVTCFKQRDEIRILNPEDVLSVSVDGNKVDPGKLAVSVPNTAAPVRDFAVAPVRGGSKGVDIFFTLNDSVVDAQLAVLLKPGEEVTGSKSSDSVEVTFSVGSVEAEPEINAQKGVWAWYTVPVTVGVRDVQMIVDLADSVNQWSGSAEVWLVTQQKTPGTTIRVDTKLATDDRVMPPLPYAADIRKEHTRLGSVGKISLKR